MKAAASSVTSRAVAATIAGLAVDGFGRARGIPSRALVLLMIGAFGLLLPLGAAHGEASDPSESVVAVDRPPADGRAGQPQDDEAMTVPGRRPAKTGGTDRSPVGSPSASGSGSPSGQTVPQGGPGLDALLRLPTGFSTGDQRSVAGAGEAEWRRRFAKARDELEAARAELAATRRELDSVAEGGGSSQWSVAPPGASESGGPGTSPLSFKLRQDLKRDRERLEQNERAMRELRIEADLAGVPPEWRGDSPSAESRRPVSASPSLD